MMPLQNTGNRSSGTSKSPFLSVQSLCKNYIINTGLLKPVEQIKAVKNVSFDLDENDTLGLIGESGSGKSTIAMLLLRLIEPDSGKILLFGEDITKLSQGEMRHKRKDFQIVFQHTQGVLDPKMTIYELIEEPLRLHTVVSPDQMETEVQRLFEMVGLPFSEKWKYPNQLSGGQNQRVIIARAIATRPKLIICDEPVSALDVSVQGQILNLLLTLQREMNLSYIFISHDLKVIRHMCQNIAVMYKGELVEFGPTVEVLARTQHHHTRDLIDGLL